MNESSKSNGPTKQSPATFRVVYLGEYTLDRRYTQAMIPWIMAAVWRRHAARVVLLSVESATLCASVRPPADTRPNAWSKVFEHKLSQLARFTRSPLDSHSFSYLTRANSEAPYMCHVFHSADESVDLRLVYMSASVQSIDDLLFAQLTALDRCMYMGSLPFQHQQTHSIQQLFDAIHLAVKISNSHQLKPNQDDSGGLEGKSPPTVLTCPSSRLYEVLYVGKVLVSTKNAPPTFIDDAVKKFIEFDRLQKESETDNKTTELNRDSSHSVQSLPAHLQGFSSRLSGPKSSTEGGVSLGSDDAFLCAASDASSQSGAGQDSLSTGGTDSAEVFYDGVETTTDSTSDRVNNDNASDKMSTGKISTTSDKLSSGKLSTGSQGISENGGGVGRSGKGGGDSSSLEDCGRNGERDENSNKKQKRTSGEKTRIMLIQVGKSELSLISLDRKSVIFERKFKDISFCSQGIINPEHFGFISRDPESDNFTCYVFQCASELVVEDIMLTLKQAFQSAFQLSTKSLVICELCPMHQLHRLCQDVDRGLLMQNCSDIKQMQKFTNKLTECVVKLYASVGLNGLNVICSIELGAELVNATLQQRAGNPQTVQDSNELIMAALLGLSEDQQRSHVHITDVGKTPSAKYEFILVAPKSKSSKLDGIRKLYKKSFAKSVEHFVKTNVQNLLQSQLPAEGERKASSWTSGGSSGGGWPSTSSSGSTKNSENLKESVDKMDDDMSLGGAKLRNRPMMEDLYVNDVNPVRLQVESSATEVRQRRHSLPHSPSFESAPSAPAVLGDSNEVTADIKLVKHSVSCGNRSPSTVIAVKDGRHSIGYPYIPENSPMRTMFLKVGNNAELSSMNGKEKDSTSFTSLRQTPRSMSTSGGGVGGGGSVYNNPSRSWRLSLLNKVVTSSPLGNTASDLTGDSYGDIRRSSFGYGALQKGLQPLQTGRMRVLWKKAILDTMMLIRMNRENKIHETDTVVTQNGDAGGSVREGECRDIQSPVRLDYEEITPCLKEVTKLWDAMVSDHERPNKLFSMDQLTSAVRDGVPREKRGDVWELLVEQHRKHFSKSVKDRPPEGELYSYHCLLKQLTQHQHAILIDLGRTFPGHPYFSTQLGSGQLSLFNILKAYSLLDRDVGYCQGISFVAGILLMHNIPEEKAFEVLKYMMFDMGFRRQYRPDMVPLQIQMYQLSRLLHDQHKDLYEHFEEYEIAPTLYAAPWFLTIFASQFPLGFVGRVFDLIFLFGIEVVLKVSLILLGNHKELIKQCDGFESIVQFLKTTLPEMGIIQMERVINQVFEMDISKELEAYELEYHVLQEELTSLRASQVSSAGPRTESLNDKLSRSKATNESLRRQKMELLEQLQVARRQIHLLEEQNNSLQSREVKLESQVQALELERTALLNTVADLRNLIPTEQLSRLNGPSNVQ